MALRKKSMILKDTIEKPILELASDTDVNEDQGDVVVGDATADVLAEPADYSSMDLDELTSRARDLHALLDDRKTKAEAMIKETGVWTRRLGEALQAAKVKLKITGGGWLKWLSEVAQIPESTAREAIRVYKGTESEDEVRGLPVTIAVRLQDS